MDATDIKEMLVLDTAKHADIAEAASKLEPGDKLTMEVEVTVSEAGDKVLSFAVTDAEIIPDETPEAEAAEDTGEGEGAPAGDSAAVALFKGKDAASKG